MTHEPSSREERVGELFVQHMGSLRFLIGQSILIFVWICLNIAALIGRWDPYPFILLNLFLSMLAAVQGNHQGALMAPTEVLAEQHYAGIQRLRMKALCTSVEMKFNHSIKR